MMQPAKSCATCYHCGSLTYGPDCRFGTKEVCCEDWCDFNTVSIRATIDLDIDLRAFSFGYGCEIRTFDDLLDLLRISRDQFVLKMLTSEDESVTIEDVQCQTEDGFQAAQPRSVTA